MDDKPIRQQEIQVFRHCQVIHRDRFGEGLERHADSHMTAAQTLALPDLVSRNVFTGSVHNLVGIRTPENRTVLQLNDFEPVSIFLNTDFLCFGVHDLSSVLVIGFHHAFRHAAFHQLRKGNGRTVRQQDAGFSGEASRCAENQAVGVLELLSVNYDKVVGKGVQTVIQRLAARLKKLLGGERDKDCRTGSGQASLDLHQVTAQRQAAH